jgi:signal transduction histidine kinase
MDYEEKEKQVLINDIREKCLWGVSIRYIIVGAGLLLFAFSFFGQAHERAGLGLILFVAAYNLAAHLLHRIRKQFKLWQVILLRSVFQVADVIAITILIYVTGWVESPYWFLYLALIVISGFGMFTYYSLSVFLIATFSAVFYLGLLWSAYVGIIPVYGTGFTLSPQELLLSVFNKAIFTTVSFFLFAGTIYYFSKLLSRHRQELTQKNMQLLSALEEVKDVDSMKDEFISTASHELRTPLSVVRENISLIEDGVVGEVGAKQKKLLSTSRQNVDRLAKILDNLLDISKIESRSLDLNRRVVDICLIAGRAVEMLMERAQLKKISITAERPEKLMAWVDEDQILRVFINLIDNAIKYTARNGRIWVGVEDSGTRIKVHVRDNGMGIAKKDMSRVFDRFVRFDNADSWTSRGSGLGLSICKGIVEMHGGRIWVESKPGRGTKFIFALPKGESSE